MSEPLSPAAMAAVTSAAARPAPRAIRHFGLAAMEARAARARAATTPPAAPAPPVATPPLAARPVRVRLWLPLTPLFLLLAPFALVLALFGYLVPPRWRRDPILTALGVGRLLLAAGGTEVDVRTSDAVVRIKIF